MAFNTFQDAPSAHKPYVRKSHPKKPFGRDDLIIQIVKLGYRYYKPVSSTWTDAFVLKQGEDVLCILMRKNGIDLRFYPKYTDGIQIIDGRNIATRGGFLYRNHFYGSKNLITKKVRAIAGHFVRGEILDVMEVEEGFSYRLKPNFAEIKTSSRNQFWSTYDGLQEAKQQRGISSYIRNDCGGYLGDGEWL
jgi:hypothetical protein